MAQYIDKDALVADIKRRMDENRGKQSLPQYFGMIEEDLNILSIIDTLEVKDVDLEKELDKFYGMYRKDGQTFSLEDNEECLDWKVDCNPNFEKAFAKHFFELGLKVAQKGEGV